MNSIDFGKYFSELRMKAGFETQSGLAEAAGLSRSTISRIETGDTESPSMDSLAKLAPHLKISKEELLEMAGLIQLHTEQTPEFKEFARIFNLLSPRGRQSTLAFMGQMLRLDNEMAAASERENKNHA